MELVETIKRNKLYWIKSRDLEVFSWKFDYPHVDIGKVVAEELTRNPPGRHVSLDTDEFLKTYLWKLLANQECSSKGLILENLGILLEPDLNLNPVRLFLELSLDAVMVLVWDHAIIEGTHFVWDESEPGYGFVFPSHTITNMELPDEHVFTSDHGNIEAHGIGAVSMSSRCLSNSRSKRHIEFTSEDMARAYLASHPEIKAGQRNTTVFLRDTSAFCSNSPVVTHGGSHILEMVVPFGIVGC